MPTEIASVIVAGIAALSAFAVAYLNRKRPSPIVRSEQTAEALDRDGVINALARALLDCLDSSQGGPHE